MVEGGWRDVCSGVLLAEMGAPKSLLMTVKEKSKKGEKEGKCKKERGRERAKRREGGKGQKGEREGKSRKERGRKRAKRRETGREGKAAFGLPLWDWSSQEDLLGSVL